MRQASSRRRDHLKAKRVGIRQASGLEETTNALTLFLELWWTLPLTPHSPMLIRV
jgi:hypothetical protein